MGDVYIRYVPLPPHIEGVTLPNSDTTFDVYINSLISQDRQLESIRHEIRHIKKNHFYSCVSVVFNEMEACRVV